jgi:hypothetical protein
LLQAKLTEVEDKRRQLAQVAKFLRSKLKDLPTSDQAELGDPIG